MSLDPAQTILQRQITVNAPQGPASFTGSIVDNVLTVTAVASGIIQGGMQLSGAGLPGGIFIVKSDSFVPGVPSAGGGGTPTGANPGLNLNTSFPGQATPQQATTYPNTVVGGRGIAMTGNGGLGTYLVNQSAAFASGALTAAFAQLSTGPSVQTNQNPAAGALPAASGASTLTAPINPGAVGYAVNALPYSPGATYSALLSIQNNLTGVNNPVVLFPAAGQEQVNIGNSIINRAFPQWSGGGEAGFVTAKQG